MTLMNVLLYSRAFLPSLGGIEQASYVLARGLANRGHRVIVATDVPAAGAGDDAALGFEVLRGRRVSELVHVARGVDVVHTNGHSMVAFPIAWRARRPLVVTHQGYQARCLSGMGWHDSKRCGYALSRCAALTREQQGTAYMARQLVRHTAARASLGLVAANVAVSAFVCDQIAAPRSTIVYNCADTSVFVPEPGARAGERFLFIGRFVREKGIDVLLRAVARCAAVGTPVGLDLVGGGPMTEELRRTVHERKLEPWVTFRGRLSGHALAAAIRSSLAVVVPSTWDEAFGIVAAEAISCGRPAIVSAAGGLPEVVDDASCTVPAGDDEAWANALLRVRTNTAWRESVERRLPVVAARFTESRHVEGYLEVYRRVI